MIIQMCKITNAKFHDSLSPVDVNWMTKFKQESIMQGRRKRSGWSGFGRTSFEKVLCMHMLETLCKIR